MNSPTSHNAQFDLLPPDSLLPIIVTASVGFVSPEGQPDLLVIVKNKRGWDMPGGHLEAAESPQQAFERELMEEAGCKLLGEPLLVATVTSKSNPSTGIAIYRGICQLPPAFIPQFEIEAVKLIPAHHFLSMHYTNDKALLKALMERAQITR